MDGAWGFYPGFGYMFASAYPWGWMPYRYGSWAFVPGFGWGWQPGGWNTWVPIPRYTATTLTHVTSLTPPAVGTMRPVVVGRAGAASTMQTSGLRVNAGTAGMGIPRGSLDNMRGLNHQVARSGFAQVRPAPQFSATSPNRSSFGYEGARGTSGYEGPRGSTGGSRPMGGSPSMGGAPAAHGGASAPAAHSTGSGAHR
jgi:hypothetical protein